MGVVFVSREVYSTAWKKAKSQGMDKEAMAAAAQEARALRLGFAILTFNPLFNPFLTFSCHLSPVLQFGKQSILIPGSSWSMKLLDLTRHLIRDP